MSKIETLIRDLPDPESASRFLEQLAEKHPSQSIKLNKNEALLSDVLTLVSFSPLLAATLLQNPDYLWWLNRKRRESLLRTKDDLLESLARFALTNSRIEPQVLLARFRRRELLRIFLRDIRRLATIAEITEEISNLADAILENALRIATQELDNRSGSPLEIDAKGRKRAAAFCVVSLGKLGSKELNYASDIDLLFIYSDEGSTSGSGSRGAITNREYFVKLAESITKLVGQQVGEGAAYRVDLRLRPYGRVGSLALSLKDTIRYYTAEAAGWERQVLVRSRSSAGDSGLFKQFFSKVEDSVFSKHETVENALRSVRLSKQKIDRELKQEHGFNVKLGRGGIREIEFIAQALQLAYGGRDKWLRSPHTLISIARLADRKLLSERELTELFDAYKFLRHLEHILQMENGLQTHTLPNDSSRRELVAKRMRFAGFGAFEKELLLHTGGVSRIFQRVFAAAAEVIEIESPADAGPVQTSAYITPLPTPDILEHAIDVSPRFAELVRADQGIASNLQNSAGKTSEPDFLSALAESVAAETGFRRKIGALRKRWSALLAELILLDVAETVSVKEIKRRQTELAEASIEIGMQITNAELERRYSIRLETLPLAVLGLGKLGGSGIDYDSDLDLVLVYDEVGLRIPESVSHPEFFSRAAEIFVTTLSSMTREGSLYRVDLRLRPHGKNGPTAISRDAFLEYMRNEATIWEMLAYVKIRSVGGNHELARLVENEIRTSIHERAADLDAAELASETKRVRFRLEEEKAGRRKHREIDIKYGPGGMLDIYFAMRFLQLRDNVPDDDANRSTGFMLKKLLDARSLSADDYSNFNDGYNFLSALDHNLRLTAGRSTRVPLANSKALQISATRMNLSSPEELLEKLTIHRLNIRNVFEAILR